MVWSSVADKRCAVASLTVSPSLKVVQREPEGLGIEIQRAGVLDAGEREI
jgi:hypothetical protein